MILDVGCGSGLSGEILSSIDPSEGGPHIWVGMDISASMLDIALQRDPFLDRPLRRRTSH